VLTVTLALAAELAERHDVELVSLFGSDRPPVHPMPDGVAVRVLIPREPERGGPRGWLRAWAEKRPTRVVPPREPRFDDYSLYTDLVLRRYLRSLRGGALVTMQPGLNIASARMGTDRYIRVAQDHRPFRSRPRPIREGYVAAASGLDMLLTLTNTDTKKVKKVVGGAVPVRTMPNGTPDLGGLQSAHTSRTVMAAGRLQRTKGFDVLVDAWVDVAAQHPDWRLQIWGEGEQRPALEQQIRDRGLADQVSLMGFSNQMHQELSTATLFVLSSRAEGYPRVIVEAMACGVPVVSTDCPNGPREMIQDGVDGILVPNEDAKALGAAIVDMIERGAERRREMGLVALENATARSQPVIAQRWVDLLDELAGARTQGPRR